MFKDTSGIYKIINTCNKKFYIGSAINLRTRKNVHFCKLRNNNHVNKHLQRAFNKYGEENFKFEVIEIIENINNLLTREQYWIDKLDACNCKVGYNKRLIAESNLGYKHSEEAKINMSIAHIGNTHTEATKEKIFLNNPKRLEVVNLDTNEIFKSARQAGRVYHTTHISEVCRGERITAGGYRWIYREIA